MRVVTWNINGVRTLPQYHPWNTMKSHDDILSHLEADIICFQEVKSSRSALPKPVALPPSYNAFFSFPVRKSGYSGVATYTRSSTVVPLKAEEGLCSIIEPKPALSLEERVSSPSAYPQRILRDEALVMPSQFEEADGPWTDPDYKDLDSEGRALVLDLGMFVLINVYCPNDGNGTEERDRYKADFHRVLKARVQGLIEKERREVVLVGDINACAAVIDHCEGHLMVAKGIADGMSGEEGFWGKDARRWLRDLLVDEPESTGRKGYLVDVTRQLHPDRKGMYTCWNTKISARDSNYGTRIDYILITPGLLPWVKGADIQPQIKGSDHCPVYLDLLDEIPDPSREGCSIKLQNLLGVKGSDGKRDPPRIASKFWAEYSGKQMLLMGFFGKKGADGEPTTPTPASSDSLSTPCVPEISPSTATTPHETAGRPAGEFSDPQADSLLPPNVSQDSSTSSISAIANDCPTPTQTTATPVSQQAPNRSISASSSPSLSKTGANSTSTAKRKLTTDTLSRVSSSSSSKRQKHHQKAQGQGQGQTKLSTFFSKPSPSSSSTKRQSKSKSGSNSDVEAGVSLAAVSRTASGSEDPELIDVDMYPDHYLAPSSQEQEPPEFLLSQNNNGNGNGSSTSKEVWSALLAPIATPKCIVHGEPAKEFTVNKQGPNKGKRFFICARPVGPGYDKGRVERRREHVDSQWKCDFFKWSSDVRKEMARRKG